MRIAIATYIDNEPNLIREFGWLYRSWSYSGSRFMSQIIAFHHPDINVKDLPQDIDIIYIPQQPLTTIEPEWKDYPFINSAYFLTTPEAATILSNYEYVLKTDNDCFLTPNFPSLNPRLAMFGIGLYALDPLVAARLVQIAFQWGIIPVFNNIGSTFLVRYSDAMQYAQVHMEYCRKLKQDEFKDGYGTWPGWYFGVLTMYAGNLAANAVFGTSLTMGGVDVHCMANGKIGPNDYHIHAFHTYDHFSKFKWRNGEYSNHDMRSLNKNVISDYCLFIAGCKP
jgi:hypothetical protein